MESRWMVCVFAIALGCSEGGGATGDGGTGGDRGPGGTGGEASPYASKDLWLCRPDIENDQCDRADLSTTELFADGSVVVSEVDSNPDAPIDCFYVYHTVLGAREAGNPGNAENLSPTDPDVVFALLHNGAHFRGVCRVFAPLYHQMDLSTYFSFTWQWMETDFWARAYGDVVDAFEYYMEAHNDGRDFVLVGHSQGSHVLATLLEEKFDDDPSLRAQLLSAILIGPTNLVRVAEGELVGGNFDNIPLCTAPGETGCVIAFDAVAANTEYFPDRSVPDGPGAERACVNPASIGGGSGVLKGVWLSRAFVPDLIPSTVDTAFVRYPDMFEARCSQDRLLEIDLTERAPTDTREVPITPQETQAIFAEQHFTANNLHSVEAALTLTDLIAAVEQQIESREE